MSNEIKALLKTKHLKSTTARIALIQTLKDTTEPLSAPELLARSKQKTTDKVTLYRNLDTLTIAGIIKKIHLSDRKAYYEIASHTHHHHIVCTTCGTIKDIHGCAMNISLKEILKETGFSVIMDHALEFFGTCHDCQPK